MNVTTHVVGIDPGLVDTGVVRLSFVPNLREIRISHEVVPGPDAAKVRGWVEDPLLLKPAVFIEAYRPRSNFASDGRMVEAIADLRKALPYAQVLTNTGVKKVVRRPLMELIGCWSFATPTHHQDLRSAARIAVFGMLKDDLMNRLLANVVRDHVAGQTWLTNV